MFVLSDDTVIRVVRELLDSALFWGFKKVVIINGHDGNIAPIEIAARDFKVRTPISDWPCLTPGG